MSHWKFLDVKLARVTVRITALMEKNRLTAADRGKGVLYLIILSLKSVNTLNHRKFFV